MTDTIAQVRQVQAQKQREAEAAFQELANRVAAGDGELTPNEIEGVLAAAGKSIDDLERAVEQLRERQRLKETASDFEAAQQSMREVRQELSELQRDHEAACKAYDARKAEIDADLTRAMQRMQQASQAKRKLAETCGDDQLRQRRAALQDQLRQLAEKREGLQNVASRLQDQVERLDQAVDRYRRSQAAGYQAASPKAEETDEAKQLAAARGELEKAKADLAYTQREIETTQTAIAEVDEQMTAA